MNIETKKDINRAIEALVMAMGREQNTLEFYEFLAKNSQHQATKKFFEDIVEKEAVDIKQTEDFLKELEDYKMKVEN